MNGSYVREPSSASSGASYGVSLGTDRAATRGAHKSKDTTVAKAPSVASAIAPNASSEDYSVEQGHLWEQTV